MFRKLKRLVSEWTSQTWGDIKASTDASLLGVARSHSFDQPQVGTALRHQESGADVHDLVEILQNRQVLGRQRGG